MKPKILTTLPGYTAALFRADLMAGITVATVALQIADELTRGRRKSGPAPMAESLQDRIEAGAPPRVGRKLIESRSSKKGVSSSTRKRRP